VAGFVYNGRARHYTKPWITFLRNRSLPSGQSCCQRVDGIRIRVVNRVRRKTAVEAFEQCETIHQNFKIDEAERMLKHEDQE